MKKNLFMLGAAVLGSIGMGFLLVWLETTDRLELPFRLWVSAILPFGAILTGLIMGLAPFLAGRLAHYRPGRPLLIGIGLAGAVLPLVVTAIYYHLSGYTGGLWSYLAGTAAQMRYQLLPGHNAVGGLGWILILGNCLGCGVGMVLMPAGLKVMSFCANCDRFMSWRKLAGFTLDEVAQVQEFYRTHLTIPEIDEAAIRAVAVTAKARRRNPWKVSVTINRCRQCGARTLTAYVMKGTQLLKDSWITRPLSPGPVERLDKRARTG